MRINRRSIESRLQKAERAVAFCAVDRAAELLRDEVYAAPPETQVKIMRGVERARRSGAAPRDAVRTLLAEIALVEPGIAARIAAAVGVTITEPSTTTPQ